MCTFEEFYLWILEDSWQNRLRPVAVCCLSAFFLNSKLCITHFFFFFFVTHRIPLLRGLVSVVVNCYGVTSLSGWPHVYKMYLICIPSCLERNATSTFSVPHSCDNMPEKNTTVIIFLVLVWLCGRDFLGLMLRVFYLFACLFKCNNILSEYLEVLSQCKVCS